MERTKSLKRIVSLVILFIVVVIAFFSMVTSFKSQQLSSIHIPQSSIDKAFIEGDYYRVPNVDGVFAYLDLIGEQAEESSNVILTNLAFQPSLKKDNVAVFFATNRQKDKLLSTLKKAKYNNFRGYKVSYGKIIVNIPEKHTSGEIERPNFFRKENPKKHIMFLEQQDFADVDNFFSQLTMEGKKKTLIFIHGYNVPFEDAIFRTAQISHDIKFTGVTMAFSWPSKGNLQGYMADEADAEWSIPYFVEFLAGVLKNQQDHEIYIIAHSMGSRVVSQALKLINPEESSRIRELILAAPDIDADVFNEQILPAFKDRQLMTTLYVATNDKALRLSRALHGNMRAGLNREHGKHVELIDATKGKVDFLGHSNFAQNEILLHDIYKIIECNIRAGKRNLPERETANITYWSMPEENKKMDYSCLDIAHINKCCSRQPKPRSHQ